MVYAVALELEFDVCVVCEMIRQLQLCNWVVLTRVLLEDVVNPIIPSLGGKRIISSGRDRVVLSNIMFLDILILQPPVFVKVAPIISEPPTRIGLYPVYVSPVSPFVTIPEVGYLSIKTLFQSVPVG